MNIKVNIKSKLYDQESNLVINTSKIDHDWDEVFTEIKTHIMELDYKHDTKAKISIKIG